MRYFRASEEVYEQARLTLDQAWGLPDGTGTQTCFVQAANAPRDAQGKPVLAVSDEFCEYSVAKDMLPQLLASGAVEEIDEATYWAAMPQVTAPTSSLPGGSMTINGGLGGLKLGG
jgi:hypothetical protein